MTNMLVALVAKGINLYLRGVATGQGIKIAEMILHHLSHIASKMFYKYQLDGRWMPSLSGNQAVIAIKFRWRPKLTTELKGNRPTIVSQQTGVYQPQVSRGQRALWGVPSWAEYQ